MCNWSLNAVALMALGSMKTSIFVSKGDYAGLLNEISPQDY